ncbi:hypothetical protein D5086_018110 [Populus alba]|uniref:Uncharacterized protein n=1 Tax=Populus alba TaxID=43335 RepID=A0ACC4BPG4_POPAL
MQLRFCFWPDYEAHILTVLAGNFFEDELDCTGSRLITMSGSIQFREAAKREKRTPTATCNNEYKSQHLYCKHVPSPAAMDSCECDYS